MNLIEYCFSSLYHSMSGKNIFKIDELLKTKWRKMGRAGEKAVNEYDKYYIIPEICFKSIE